MLILHYIVMSGPGKRLPPSFFPDDAPLSKCPMNAWFTLHSIVINRNDLRFVKRVRWFGEKPLLYILSELIVLADKT